MAHPLAELKSELLGMDDPSQLLRIADSYLSSMGKLGSAFILPNEHRIIRPILEYFPGDLEAWLKYVRQLYRVMPVGAGRSGVYDLMRTLEIRNTQRERRIRITAATNMAIKLGLIEDLPEERLRYSRRCVQVWTKERQAMLNGMRRNTKTGRLNEDERSLALDNFWAQIDEGIAVGKVPEP